MDYEISKLSDELIFIRWNRSPDAGDPSEMAFVKDVEKLLEEATQPLYFISDLRKGRISNIQILRRLAGFGAHENWGSSTAFSDNPLTTMFVEMFSRFLRRTNKRDEVYHNPREAIQFIESSKPGITQSIDWDSVLNPRPQQVKLSELVIIC